MAETSNNQIITEITKLGLTVENLRTGMSDRFLHLEKKIQKTTDLLTGDDTPEKGLIVRVDRLERSAPADLSVRVDRLEVAESRRTKVFWAVTGTMLSVIGGIIITLVKLSHP